MSQPSAPSIPPRPTPLTPEHIKSVVEIWKHSVDVQMHFNDMGMRIRNLYFTFLAAAVGLIGVIQGKHVEVAYPSLTIHMALFVLMAVIPISMLFHFLDAHWYHRLLLGAVKHCGFIEERYADVLPELGLGAAISKESPVKFEGPAWRWLFFFVADPRFKDRTKRNIHSDAKIEVLYKSIIWGAVALIIPYIFFGGIEYDHHSLAQLIFDP